MRRRDDGFGFRGGCEAAAQVSLFAQMDHGSGGGQAALRWKKLESCDASWTVAVLYRLWPRRVLRFLASI